MPYQSSILLSWTQLWRACGVGARTHFVLEFMERTPTGAECKERNAMSMLSQCVSERSAQSLERHFSLLFRLGRKNMKNGTSLIDYAVSHTAYDVGKNLDYAGAMVCGSSLFRCGVRDRCCARLQGEHHPDHARSPL